MGEVSDEPILVNPAMPQIKPLFTKSGNDVGDHGTQLFPVANFPEANFPEANFPGAIQRTRSAIPRAWRTPPAHWRRLLPQASQAPFHITG
jgi:hypothetical protein